MFDRKSVTAALLVLGSLSLQAAPTRAADPPKGSPEQKQTIVDIRNVGTAMFSWYRDQLKAHPKPEAKKEEPTPPAPDFGRLPAISREDLAKLLVPKYIPSIPAADGWGHPYEFYLNTTDLDAQVIMGLRSAGRDGKFSGSAYTVDSFSPTDEDQDIVWMDGYFVRWPQVKPS